MKRGWSGIGYLGLGCVSYESTHEYGHECGSQGVAHAAELYQLVAAFSASAQSVEHGVDDSVEHAHAETGDKGTGQVHAVALDSVPSRYILEEYAGEAHCNRGKGSLLISYLFKQYAGRDAHDGVGDEVGRVAQLGHGVGYVELVLDDDSHRVAQIGHESDHEEQQVHHRYRERIVFLFSHISTQLMFV